MSALSSDNSCRPTWFAIAPARLRNAWESLQIEPLSDQTPNRTRVSEDSLCSAIGTVEVLTAGRRAQRQIALVGILSTMVLVALIAISWQSILTKDDELAVGLLPAANRWNWLISLGIVLINSVILSFQWRRNGRLIRQHQLARRDLIFSPQPASTTPSSIMFVKANAAHEQLTSEFLDGLTGLGLRAGLGIVVILTALAAMLPWMQLMFWIGDFE